MWNYASLQISANQALVDRFRKYAKISGGIFILLGLVGIFFPTFMTMTAVALVSYLMLFAGVSSAWFTWTSHRKDWAGWLKSLMLILVAALMIFYPLNGAATLGMLLAVYFFVDAFAEFGLAFSQRPNTVWLLWLLNGIISLGLGVIFVVGWPFNSLYLVGLFVGISLFFDGVALLSGGIFLDKATKNS